MATIERVEELTTETYGKGACVSVNQESGHWAVRCWDRTGVEMLECIRSTKASAIDAMEMELRLMKANASP